MKELFYLHKTFLFFFISSKKDYDSEQEDSEVRKLTAKMEKEKVQQQRSPSTHSSHQTILKKTMIQYEIPQSPSSVELQTQHRKNVHDVLSTMVMDLCIFLH